MPSQSEGAPIQFALVERRVRDVSDAFTPAAAQSVRGTWSAQPRFHTVARFVLVFFIDDTAWSQSEDTVFRHEVLS